MKIALAIFAAAALTAAAQDSALTKPQKKGYRTTLSAYIGQKHSLGSAEFFENYVLYFGGRKLNFPLGLSFGASAKIELLPDVRFGVHAERFTVAFADNYSQDVFRQPTDPTPSARRQIAQNYTFTAMPVLLTAEFTPVASVYRTYVGAGVGAAFGTMQWTETLGSTDPFDKRKGGEYANGSIFGPAGAVYAGVELGFDRSVRDGDLISLTAEVRYTVIGISEPLFAKAAEQFANPPQSWSESVPIGASGLTLQLGLSFQFSPK